MEVLYPVQLMQCVFEDLNVNSIFSPESCSSLFGATRDGFDQITQSFLDRLFEHSSEKYSKSLNLFDKKLWKKTKLFVRKESPLEKEFKNNLENKFGCDVDEVDMKEAESANMINRWISENVCDLSGDFFQTPNMNNILKLDFEWDSTIKSKISKKQFKSKNNTFETEFVDLSGKIRYVSNSNLDAKFIEIPLSSDNLSILLAIPNQKDGLENIKNRLNSYELSELFSEMTEHEMNISIPKLKLNQEHNLKDLLQKVDNFVYPYKFGKMHGYRLGAMKTVTFMEVKKLGVKAEVLAGCQFILSPVVTEMVYESNISNRYAQTLIRSRVENVEYMPQETTFTVVLPEDAFISEFVMEIKEKLYKSYVQEKEEAKITYNQAVASGKSAGHIAVSARDSNKFTVSVNIEPRTQMKFLLTYEELLQRKYNQYELVVNVHPGQLVQTLKVLARINESKLRFVKTPAMRSGYEITYNEGTNLYSKIDIFNSMAIVTFEPTLENQIQISKMLGTDDGKGISGQFVVQYDVELDPSNGEVLINDGYFVHFYAPDDIPPLDKHVVFTLDTSGSMGGRKIEQLKDAMKCILDQIKTNDIVDILDFTTNVTFHDIETRTIIGINYEYEQNFAEPFYKYERYNFPDAKPVNSELIIKAKSVVDNLRATSSTNIIGALETALYLVNIRQKKYPNYQPMIVFLTDGQPNVGIRNPDEITYIITKLNLSHQKTPIFALSFGDDADKNFLRKLSLGNFGFSRHIYVASDASLQLQQFYKEISSPLLSEVSFKYNYDVTEITRTEFPIYFRGSHIIICGRHVLPEALSMVHLYTKRGNAELKITVEKSTTQLERLWAYLTIKQLLEKREKVEDKAELTKKVLELALKYSFVTEVTSLVVVKPEESSTASAFHRNSNQQCLFTNDSSPSLFGGIFGSASSQSVMALNSYPFGSTSSIPVSFMEKKKEFISGPSALVGCAAQQSSCLFGTAGTPTSNNLVGYAAPQSANLFGSNKTFSAPNSFGFVPHSTDLFGSTGSSRIGLGYSKTASGLTLAVANPQSTATNLFGSTTSNNFQFGINNQFAGTGQNTNTFGLSSANANVEFTSGTSNNNNFKNPQVPQFSFGAKQKSVVSNSVGNQHQETDNFVPKDIVVDRPFLIMVKFKLDNKNVISFVGNITKPLVSDLY